MYFSIITLNVKFSIVKVDVLLFQFVNDFTTFSCNNETRSFDYNNRQIITVPIFLFVCTNKFLLALNEKTNVRSNDSPHVYELKKYKCGIYLDRFRFFDSFLYFRLIFFNKIKSTPSVFTIALQ